MMSDKSAIEAAIRDFDWAAYYLYEVVGSLEDNPENLDWVTRLTDTIYTRMVQR